MLITGTTEEAWAIENHPMVIRVHANDMHHNAVAVAEVHVQSLDVLFFHQSTSHQLRGITLSDPLNTAWRYPGLRKGVTRLLGGTGFDGEVS